MASDLVPREMIEQKIFLIRGHKVMLGNHLAELYDVETKRLIQAVKRNKVRFPEDFMFQLRQEELRSLRSQFVTLNDYGNQLREGRSSRSRGRHPQKIGARHQIRKFGGGPRISIKLRVSSWPRGHHAFELIS
jgi:hypothetical protein